ncbi:MAG: transglutaminase family protein [Verrucomicrobiota bacterium]
MRLRIEHTTEHKYDGLVSFSDHKIYLRPLDSHRREVHAFIVETHPNSSQRWVRDAYGNLVLVCKFGLETDRALRFSATMEVSIMEENPFDFILESYATAYPFAYREPDTTSLLPFMSKGSQKGALRILDWFYTAVPQPLNHSDVVQFLSDLNAAIFRDIDYARRDEEGIQEPDTTLGLRTGSCRDMAVLFIAVVRQLGFAARFVSGYLYDPPSKDGSDEHLFNRAMGSMHAWAEVYLPGAGWKGFDPTNGILSNQFFVPSAVSHDPFVISPVQGDYFSEGPVSSDLSVDLKIEEVT